MGVVRYKSTGNMLEAAEMVLAANRRQQKDYEADNDNEDEDDEMAKKRPLLKVGGKHQRQVDSAKSKWSSCKFLGRNHEDDDDGDSNKQENEYEFTSKKNPYSAEEMQIEMKKWHKIGDNHEQVKLKNSTNDLLAFSSQAQQVAKLNKGNKQVGCHQFSGDESKNEEVGFSEVGQRLKPVDRCKSQVYDSNDQIRFNKNPTKFHQPATAKGGGPTRRRRAARMKLASLSLSSPALAAASLRENGQANSSVSAKGHLLRRLRNNERRIAGQTDSGQRDEDNNNDEDDGIAAAGGALARQPVDVHASETKAYTGSGRNRFNDCFVVDVSQLQQLERRLYLTNAESGSNSCLAYIDGQKDAVRQTGRMLNGTYDNGSERLELASLAGQGNFGGQSHDGQPSAPLPSACLAGLADKVTLAHEQPDSGHYSQAQHFEPASASRTTVPAATHQEQSQVTCAVADCRAQTGGDIMPIITNRELMVDTNKSVAGLIGSYCTPWRQALQLHPNSSGSYKVARLQRQVELISGSDRNHENKGTVQAIESEQETTGRECENDRLHPSQQHVNNVQKVSARDRRMAPRSLRPSRSPISLQRQTNARLTWHRIKIQQQRQEQLAQLALRERQQLNLQSQYHGNRQHLQNSSRRLNIENRRGQPDYEEFYMINGLHNGTSPQVETINNTSRSSHASRNSFAQQQAVLTDNNREYRLSFNDGFESQNHKQHQVISPTEISGAIEICDNQPACSSRQEQRFRDGFRGGERQQQVTSTTSGSKEPRSLSGTGNVIVYKSINMLTSSSSGMNHQQYHHLGNIKRSNNDCDGIDSDDALTISSSASTLSLDKPFCKICHVGATKNGDKLISPCKCSGTMQYIHCGCLLKWLEISNRTNEKPMNCELCAHEYTWHKKFNYKHMKLPKCSLKDLFLHMIFIAAIGAMLLSATAPMLYRKPGQDATIIATGTSTTDGVIAEGHKSSTIGEQQQNRRQGQSAKASYINHATLGGTSNHLATGRLAHDEKFMLVCAAAFFVSFFLAIYVQTRARDTLYGLVVKFLSMNQTYYITEYDHGQLNGIGNSVNNNCCSSKQQQLVNRGEITTQPARKSSE